MNLAKCYWKPWMSWKALFKDYSNFVIYHLTPNPKKKKKRAKFKILNYNPVWPIPKCIYIILICCCLSFVWFLPTQLRETVQSGKEFEGRAVPTFSSKSMFSPPWSQVRGEVSNRTPGLELPPLLPPCLALLTHQRTLSQPHTESATTFAIQMWWGH